MSDKEHEKVINILLVEDSMGDIRLTQEVFKEGKIHNELVYVKNGEDALAYLHREGKFANAVRPDLILLDLNLPRKDGRAVLEEIKSDNDLARIPVVVLTTSKAEEDIQQMYDLHANCFITKPFDLDKYITVAKSIQDFWFSIVKLPYSTNQPFKT